MASPAFDVSEVHKRQELVNHTLMSLAQSLEAIDLSKSALEKRKESTKQSASDFRAYRILDDQYQELKRLAAVQREAKKESVPEGMELSAMTRILKARIEDRAQAYWDDYARIQDQ